MAVHRMTWFVYANNGDGNTTKIRRQATMRGQWGYDVECSCGEFQTRTGGATKSYIQDQIWYHKFEVTP